MIVTCDSCNFQYVKTMLTDTCQRCEMIRQQATIERLREEVAEAKSLASYQVAVEWRDKCRAAEAELAAVKLSLRDLLDSVDSHLATNEPSSVVGWSVLSKAWQTAWSVWKKGEPPRHGELGLTKTKEDEQ
jgi:hypothetical protein